MSDVTCRGSFALGTACGKCSRCRREIESYNAMKSLRDKLNTPSSALETTRKQADRIKELEAMLAKAEDGLRECEREIDDYIRQEYPYDHPVHERYRQRDFSANPARTTLAELKGTDT